MNPYIVYSVLDEGNCINQILREAGCELIIGDGTLQDDGLAVCNALIPGKCFVTEEVLNKAPNLKIVSKFGVGVDKIDIPACTGKGVWVTNTGLSNFYSVAEHTMALLLAAAKRFYPVEKVFHKELPDWDAAKGYSSIELYGKKLGIIGLGNIGRRVASIASAFDMQIIGYDPYAPKELLPEYINFKDQMEDVLKEADFLTLHVAGGESVKNMIGKRELEMMKPTAILINTTRGFVVNEQALVQALRNGTIAGAAVDVFSKEPVKETNPLLLMDCVVATPHNAANTPEARLRSQRECAKHILQVMNGEKPDFALNSILH